MDINIAPATNAMILVTNNCNLRCKYCYENRSNKVIDLQIMKDAIDFILKNAEEACVIPKITFFGGEPLLHFDDIMKSAIEYVRSKNNNVILCFVTNGLLITEDQLKFYKNNNVKFMLSIDGCKEAQDSNRIYANGSGSFDDLEEKIPLILKYDPQTLARVTVTPSNIQYLFNSLKYLESCNFDRVHIMPNVFDVWSDDDFKIAEEQLGLIKDYIINKFENDEIPLVPEIICQMFTKRVIKEYEESTNRYRMTPSTIPSKRCGIGSIGKVVIDTDGNIYTCPHCTMQPIEDEIMFIGNIYSGINADKIENLVVLNNEKPIYSNTFKCSDCPLDRICSGGCTPNNYMIYSDFNLVPECYCKWNRLLYKTAEEIVNYFDKYKTNDLFKDFFYGCVIKGVYCVC